MTVGMTLRTPLCERLGINKPVMLAGMGGVAGVELVAAVSNAGGLGVLGAASMTPDEIATAVARIRSLTDRPFGVDTLLPSTVPDAGSLSELSLEVPAEYLDFARTFASRHGLDTSTVEEPQLWTTSLIRKQIDVILDLKVPVYVAGLGNPSFLVEAAHSRDITVMALVGNVRNARRVSEGGADIIIAQGTDAGGHNSRIGTMALIPQVVDAVAPKPVVAAGGIADGRGIIAAFALGAQAVWCGTVFLTALEAETSPAQKQAAVMATEEDTVVSKSISGKPARVLKNAWTTEFEAALAPLPMPFQRLVSWSVWEGARLADRGDINPGFAGHAVGMVTKIASAERIMDELIAGAEKALAEVAGLRR